MRRSFAAFLGVIALAVMWIIPAVAADYWEEGNDGESWETAYIIDSAEDFMNMRSNLNGESGKYYKLTTDLDLTEDIDDVSLYSSYSYFEGHLDGQNHKITLALTDNTTTCGLFWEVSSDAVAIRNLNVEGSVSGGNVVGGIACDLYNGIIENCSFTGTVESIHMEDDNFVVDAGGIVGDLEHGTIRNCTFQGTVRALGINDGSAGGIIASTNGGTIENCTVLSNSTIEASHSAGGIAGEVGQNMGDYETESTYITNCTSYAQLTGNAASKGGIVGIILNDTINYFSGNSWPSEYQETGDGSSEDNYNQGGSVIPDNPVSEDTNTELPVSVVEPVTPSPDVMENLASLVSIDKSALHLITQDNISPAQEPTPTMRQQMTDDGYEPAYKLNTLNVSEDGHYVFLVNVPEEFVGKSISDIRIYALKNTDIAASIPGVVTGLLNFTEITNIFGVKIDTLETQVLAVAVLQAGTPFSVYLAKILLMLLAGGCNSGFAIMPGIFLLALISLPLLRRR